MLLDHPGAERQWGESLAGIIDSDPRTVGNVWAGVRKAMSCLDIASVRRRFDPARLRQVEIDRLLDESGTVYVIAREADPAARMLLCLVSEIARTAKARADRSPNGRLVPPLLMLLDEIANWSPLPDLPTWVSGLGGSGIVIVAVFQSRAQMEDTWGEQAATAMWDAATIKLVLGGVTSDETLRGLSALDRRTRRSDLVPVQVRPRRGGSSVSSSVRSKPVLDVGEIRQLPEGLGLLLFKGAPPMLVQMTAYYRRKDAKQLTADRARVEALILDSTPATRPAAGPAAPILPAAPLT